MEISREEWDNRGNPITAQEIKNKAHYGVYKTVMGDSLNEACAEIEEKLDNWNPKTEDEEAIPALKKEIITILLEKLAFHPSHEAIKAISPGSG